MRADVALERVAPDHGRALTARRFDVIGVLSPDVSSADLPWRRSKLRDALEKDLRRVGA